MTTFTDHIVAYELALRNSTHLWEPFSRSRHVWTFGPSKRRVIAVFADLLKKFYCSRATGLDRMASLWHRMTPGYAHTDETKDSQQGLCTQLVYNQFEALLHQGLVQQTIQPPAFCIATYFNLKPQQVIRVMARMNWPERWSIHLLRQRVVFLM